MRIAAASGTLIEHGIAEAGEGILLRRGRRILGEGGSGDEGEQEQVICLPFQVSQPVDY
jgi:hypothetical protein